MFAELYLAKNALALHLPLQRLEGLIDIVVADENLHVVLLFLAEALGHGRGYARPLSGRVYSNRPFIGGEKLLPKTFSLELH
jgi:hypothetical protein